MKDNITFAIYYHESHSVFENKNKLQKASFLPIKIPALDFYHSSPKPSTNPNKSSLKPPCKPPSNTNV